MSTESQPPSITPQRPSATSRPDLAPRRVTAPVAGDGAPSAVVGAADPGATTEVPVGPSFGDRLKKAAQGAAGAARSALPSRGEVDDDAPASAPGRPVPDGGPARTTTGGPARTTIGGAATPAPTESGGPRRVRLAIARIDPWSVMKLSFLLSFAIGIMIVVAAAVVWFTLDGLNVFTQVNDVIATLSGSTTFFDVLEYAKFDRVVSLAAMIAVVDIVLLTALATIGAFLYNIVAAMVGGIHLTLTDD